jgi:hypothetical protein
MHTRKVHMDASLSNFNPTFWTRRRRNVLLRFDCICQPVKCQEQIDNGVLAKNIPKVPANLSAFPPREKLQSLLQSAVVVHSRRPARPRANCSSLRLHHYCSCRAAAAAASQQQQHGRASQIKATGMARQTA